MTSQKQDEDKTTSWWAPGNKILPLPVACGLFIVLSGAFYFYAWPWLYWSIPGLYPNDLPGISSHWHADYVIKICDEIHPPLPYTLGDIHTHGDGLIHVHPSSPATAGKQSNLKAFFENAGGTITATRLALPPLLDVTNGDPCKDDEAGKLAVYVNQTPIEDPPSYVPRDGDSLIIYFGPPVSPPALPVQRDKTPSKQS